MFSSHNMASVIAFDQHVWLVAMQVIEVQPATQEYSVRLVNRASVLTSSVWNCQCEVLFCLRTHNATNDIESRCRYTVRFARAEPCECPVHRPIVTCGVIVECSGPMKIG